MWVFPCSTAVVNFMTCLRVQLLEEQVSLSRYWNYLRRQLYVMDTYVSPHNRRINHAMLALHTYLSWAFVLPCLTGRPLTNACNTPEAASCAPRPGT